MVGFDKTSILALFTLSLASVACGDDTDTPPASEPDSGATTQDSSTGTTSNTSSATTSSGVTSSTVTTSDAATTSEPATGDASTDGGGPALPTIAELVSGSEDFTVLASALEATGLDDTLAGDGPFTVFAPTDEAFALLPEGLVASLSTEQLTSVLAYHVLPAEVPAEAVVELTSADTALEQPIAIQVAADGVYLNGLTKVVTTDIQTSNGIVHVIDSVLIPGKFPGTITEVLGAYPRLSTLFGAATFEVAEALDGDNLTLFAPVNAAFTDVDLAGVDDLSPILFYHALPESTPASTVVELASARSVQGAFMAIDTSDGVQINDGSKLATVIYTDIEVDSGEEGSTIHLIDEVLIPPPSIAQVAEAAGLSTLVEVLSLADVPGTETTFAEALEGEGPFTVFAPPNEAFEAIPEAGFGTDLATVLGAHAIAGAVDSKAVAAAIAAGDSSPATLSDADPNTLQLGTIGETVAINGRVLVTQTDIPAANGIIHLVDSVIVPTEVTFPGNIVDALGAYPVFGKLVEAAVNAEEADVAQALQGEGPFTLFAPIDSAFEGVDTTNDLSPVLLYHAIAGAAYDSAAVVGLDEPTAFETVNGADVEVDPEGLTVNDQAIIGVDLRASNGVIHVIDGILMPPAD